MNLIKSLHDVLCQDSGGSNSKSILDPRLIQELLK